jgi:hypothetical protein
VQTYVKLSISGYVFPPSREYSYNFTSKLEALDRFNQKTFVEESHPVESLRVEVERQDSKLRRGGLQTETESDLQNYREIYIRSMDLPAGKATLGRYEIRSLLWSRWEWVEVLLCPMTHSCATRRCHQVYFPTQFVCDCHSKNELERFRHDALAIGRAMPSKYRSRL